MEQEKTEVRLKETEIRAIKNSVRSFDSQAEIYIFGSRVKPDSKGGDIDILVVSDVIGWKEKRKIRVELIKQLGDRKIDLLVARSKEIKENRFFQLAIAKGVKIRKENRQKCLFKTSTISKNAFIGLKRHRRKSGILASRTSRI